MRAALVVVVATLAMTVSGCHSIAGSDQPSAAAPSSSQSATVDSSGNHTGPGNKPLWQPGSFQNGIQLYWHTIGTQAQIQTAANQALDYIVSLGANSVGITFPIYTDGAYPTKVYAGPDTPSPANISLVVQASQARGLRIALRPTIDEKNIATNSNPLAWRGSLQPADTAQWFASYGDFLKQYVAVAQQFSIEEFVTGTELSSLQASPDQWRQLQKTLVQATGFTGLLSYTYNWNGETTMPFQKLGIDAYPEINLGDDATVTELSQAIGTWFKNLPLASRQRTVAQEVGIAATSGAYARPYLLGSPGDPLDLDIQANWFTAMCSAAHATKQNGIYYWMLDSNTDPRNPGDQSLTGWIGRPAETSIRQCFASK